MHLCTCLYMYGNLGPFAAYLSMLTVHMSMTIFYLTPPKALLVQDMFNSHHVSD